MLPIRPVAVHTEDAKSGWELALDKPAPIGHWTATKCLAMAITATSNMVDCQKLVSYLTATHTRRYTIGIMGEHRRTVFMRQPTPTRVGDDVVTRTVLLAICAFVCAPPRTIACAPLGVARGLRGPMLCVILARCHTSDFATSLNMRLIIICHRTQHPSNRSMGYTVYKRTGA